MALRQLTQDYDHRIAHVVVCSSPLVLLLPLLPPFVPAVARMLICYGRCAVMW